MPERKTANWLKAFIKYASIGEAPLSIYFWVGVATIAGALRRRVWIDQVFFKWFANFYIVIVAPPGIVSKSTTTSIGMDLLRKVPGINFGPGACSWQALVQQLGRVTEAAEMPDGSYLPMSCLTIESSELGSFLDPEERQMVDALTEIWDCRKDYSKITKTQGNDLVENPWLNIIGCTTPGWLSAAVPEHVVGGGFASRCIFIFADSKRQAVAYLHRRIPEDHAAQQAALVHDLEMIAQLRGEFTMEPGAVEFGEQWYTDHIRLMPLSDLNSEKFAGYLARKQTHIHKLAMVISASQRDNMVITRKDLEEAVKFVTSIETDMPKTFNRVGMSDAAKISDTLLAYLKEHKKAEYSHLYRWIFQKIGTNKDFDESIKSLVKAGFCSLKQQGSTYWIHYNEPPPNAKVDTV